MKRRRSASWPLALVTAFVAGIVVDSLLRTYGPPLPAGARALDRPAASASTLPAPAAPDTPLPDTTPRMAAAPSNDARPLRLPIDGMNVEAVKGGFVERRGDRPHEAVDILAPRDTPIHAVQNGTIARLFVSKQGGNTIYQFDPGGTLCYYYAHLDRYAPGLAEGASVVRGDVIGFVGTTGNAPPNTPHLHFAVFVLDADREWWKGRAIDPYPLLKTATRG